MGWDFGRHLQLNALYNNEPEPVTYLTFASAAPFTIAVGNDTKNWDGTLYYSTDTTTWNEWDGTIIESVENSGNQKIYMCGSGNSRITGTTSSAWWVLTGDEISCNGNIENLLDFETVAKGKHPMMSDHCYYNMFRNCTSLTEAPELPATTLANNCYSAMFYDCTSLTEVPALPATTLTSYCYHSMFDGCTSIKLSKIPTDEYLVEYRIPFVYTGTITSNSLISMFDETGGTFTGTPEINTTYYLHKDNRIVGGAEPIGYLYGHVAKEGETPTHTINGVDYVGAVCPDIFKVYTPELQAEFPYGFMYRLNLGSRYTYYLIATKNKLYRVDNVGVVTGTGDGFSYLYTAISGDVNGATETQWQEIEVRTNENNNFPHYPRWANYQMTYEDGTPFLEDTAPVPVYE